jgi:hypothetical protein
MTEFDNLLIGYADRTRILPEEHRRHVFTNNGIIKGTVLHDGFVTATWKATKSHLAIAPLERLPRSALSPLHAEATRLLTFLAPTTAPKIELLDFP